MVAARFHQFEQHKWVRIRYKDGTCVDLCSGMLPDIAIWILWTVYQFKLFLQ